MSSRKKLIGCGKRPVVKYIRLPINDALAQALAELNPGGRRHRYWTSSLTSYLAFVLEEAVYAMADTPGVTADNYMPYFTFTHQPTARRGFRREKDIDCINHLLEAVEV